MNTEQKILTRDLGPENFHRIDVYLKNGGYRAVKKALTQRQPGSILEEIKKSGLRGRGGAGFPTGLKWSFVPQQTDSRKYLCVNADEGEPGTFKDRFILGHLPHLLIEGVIIASYAVGIHSAYVYIRGEYETLARRLELAIDEAYEKGFLGKDILKSGFDLDLFLHRGAGAYICGEETALLESLEGKRGYPRLKPPFPATVGLFQKPTVINNIETLANIAPIVLYGADWFLSRGLPNEGGTRLFGVSGAVTKPGLYELPVGTGLREIIFTHAGGLKPGRKLKAVIPGGISAPLLKADEIDIKMDADSVAAVGSMLGSAAVIVIDDQTPILAVLKNIARFYAHESCGQCTPCRLGSAWILKIVDRMAGGEGEPGDIDALARLAANIRGRMLCPLGEAESLSVSAIAHKFRDEIEDSLKNRAIIQE
jgi:NADH-quinone oxidoreductase subunit F